jgi:starch synthase
MPLSVYNLAIVQFWESIVRKILFASSEVHPLMKTGGLADVSASLPLALSQMQQDIRIIMPAYRATLNQLGDCPVVASVKLDGYHQPIHILQAQLPDSDVIVWLVDSAEHFDRDGGPYCDPNGADWADNAARFTLFCRAVVTVATDQVGLSWLPEVVHCNDWQTGLIPALLSIEKRRPATVFTIHNMAYQGLFSREVFEMLDLPESLWQVEGIEFYGMMSFMKGGLIYADHITSVSPTYAQEICHYDYGYGLEGLLELRAKQSRLSGIVNGIDTHEWNPQTDKFISNQYSIKNLKPKTLNKKALQQHFFLPESNETLLFGMISRLVSQKGVDLTIDAINRLLTEGKDIQLVCLGSGEAGFEQDLRVLRARFPNKVGIQFGYDEALAHKIEAGVDAFLMPSRFEPCGLNQMYSLRYGTLPVVRNTGGLADTVVDASEDNRKQMLATGFKFDQPTVEDLYDTLLKVDELFSHPRLWRRMMLTAMVQDFSWINSAQAYQHLYQQLVDNS